MAINQNLIRGYLQHAIGMLPLYVTFDGVEYSGTKTARTDATELRVAGLLPDYTFSIYLDLAKLHATPEVDDTVIIGDTTYRVIEIGNDPAEAYIRLDLGNEFASR